MRDTDFLNMSAFVRVQEKRLLDKAAIDRVADTATTQEALRMLSQGTDYDFSALRRPEDYENVVKAELARVYKLAWDVAKNYPEIPEILACKYDYHNVKVALKAKYSGQAGELPFVTATPVAPEDIVKMVEKYDPKSNLPENLLLAIRTGAELFEKSGNPQTIDIALDRLMYAHMRALADKVGNGFITGYVQMLVDFYNLKALVRVKGMQKGAAFLAECLAEGGATDPSYLLANYGKNAGALSLAFAFKDYGDEFKAGIDAYESTGKYADLERLLDNRLIEYVGKAKRISFGPEILFTYLVSKENEIRQIRIVVACKQNQVPADILKERLRDNYA